MRRRWIVSLAALVLISSMLLSCKAAGGPTPTGKGKPEGELIVSTTGAGAEGFMPTRGTETQSQVWEQVYE